MTDFPPQAREAITAMRAAQDAETLKAVGQSLAGADLSEFTLRYLRALYLIELGRIRHR